MSDQDYYVQPNPNGFVPYPQNNEFLFQSNPNNFPNQFVQSPQGSASFSNNGNGLFQNVGPGPQNSGDMLSQNGMSSPNTFAHQHPQSSGSLTGFNNNGPGQNNNGNGLLNNAIPGPNSGTLGGLHNLPSGFQNGGAFMSHNALSAPNFIPNQLSQSGANSGSLNNGNGLLNNAIPGPQNSAGTLGGLHNLGSGFQNGGALMSHNALSAPNFIPNQLSPSGASSGSLNGQNFGPAPQMGSYSNGIFNGMVPPRGSNNNNMGNPESSLFQMFQQNQFRQNQMGYNQNVGKDRNIQDNCFQKTVDKSYNGISNFNDFTGAKQQDQQMQEILKQQQANQQEQQQGVNQPAQQILQQQQQQQQSDPQGQQKQKGNQEVDNFIKSILGQDIFDYAKKELKFDDGKINSRNYLVHYNNTEHVYRYYRQRYQDYTESLYHKLIYIMPYLVKRHMRSVMVNVTSDFKMINIACMNRFQELDSKVNTHFLSYGELFRSILIESYNDIEVFFKFNHQLDIIFMES
ncbi:putative uncharacterized protein DDB_G0271606 [Diaphorina citri]|uniref:Uncharacterized protein n=1 Tax=Diaphorina citri TaxID=121845 RepID=A0A3Q0IQR0_DIACI|nr:putative uncharacterized protein DDB_G0271606 [Diaphorina citri]